jgi:hypothetical protein
MARRRNAVRPELQDATLERRGLLSAAGGPGPADFGPTFYNRFNHDGISNLQLHKSFVDLLNARFNVSKNATHLTFEAFQVFQQNYLNLPVGGGAGNSGTGGETTNPSQGNNPSTGNASGTGTSSSSQFLGPPPMPDTLPALLATLTQQFDKALSTIELNTTYVGPSVVREPKYSPAAQQTLIPFANAQIAAMGTKLAALTPVPGPNGTLVQADATSDLNVAYNAILNAVAENSVHPALFPNPGDFYINPNAKFDITFDGTPAQQGPGYFVFGPGGVLLPGAPTHPHVTVRPADGSARVRN